MIKKIQNLPEHVRKQVLHELTISKICETLKDPEIVTDRDTWGIYTDVPHFNPYKPIFVFSWVQLEQLSNKNKTEQIETQRVEFNFLDCMEIMQMQEAKQFEVQEPYPQYGEDEPVIYQCGDRFELGIVKSVCGGDEYFVNYHTGETAARTHARNLHKITNGYAFWIERKRA